MLCNATHRITGIRTAVSVVNNQAALSALHLHCSLLFKSSRLLNEEQGVRIVRAAIRLQISL